MDLVLLCFYHLEVEVIIKIPKKSKREERDHLAKSMVSSTCRFRFYENVVKGECTCCFNNFGKIKSLGRIRKV